MKIASFSTRLTGGAFEIISQIQEYMLKYKQEYKVYYGYGSKGFSDSKEEIFKAKRFIESPVAISNFLTFKFIGKELFRPSESLRITLLEEMTNFDVIHLNILHSYAVNFGWFINFLIDTGLPVVWTHHDLCAITGRCASPQSCTHYKENCSPCQNLESYPSSSINRTKSTFSEKRNLIKLLENNLQVTHIAPTKWVSDLISSELLVPVKVVTNSVSDDFFQFAPAYKNIPLVSNYVFISKDLQDGLKTNGNDLTRLAQHLGSRLTVIGNHPSQHLLSTGVKYIPRIDDRSTYIETLKNYTDLIFLSRFDTFGLTPAEALVLGLRVHCLDSRAAQELSEFGRIERYSNILQLILNLDKSLCSQIGDLSKLRTSSMGRSYYDIFNSLLGS